MIGFEKVTDQNEFLGFDQKSLKTDREHNNLE